MGEGGIVGWFVTRVRNDQKMTHFCLKSADRLTEQTEIEEAMTAGGIFDT